MAAMNRRRPLGKGAARTAEAAPEKMPARGPGPAGNWGAAVPQRLGYREGAASSLRSTVWRMPPFR